MSGIKKIVVEKTTAEKREISVVFSYRAVHFIVGGYGYFNGKRLGAGDGFVCDVGQICNYYPDKTDPWEYVWAVVDGDGFPTFAQCGYTFRFERCEALRTICLELSESPEKLSNPKYSEAVLSILESYVEGYSEGSAEGAREIVLKAQSFMREHIYECLQISDIAHSLHISEGYLRHLFKINTGLSPKQYLDSQKAAYASDLLKNTDYRIDRIAVSVGYDDAQAFSKFFKKHRGLCPKEFRRKTREM